MSWVELFAVLAVCHMVGDFVVQTNWQAAHKRGGLGGERDASRALASHIATYTLTFTGEVTADDSTGRLVSVVGRCGPSGQVRGDHVTATVRLAPAGDR